MDDMAKFEVGKVFPGYAYIPECVKFGISDAGADSIVYFNDPKDSEIKQFDSESAFEIRFVVVDGIIMILLKIGNLAWMDAPYTPHLSPSTCFLNNEIEDGKGFALMLFLINNNDGVIKHIRLIGLGHKFSKALQKAALEQLKIPFDQNQYYANLSDIYSKYTTKQLVQFSNIYYKE